MVCSICRSPRLGVEHREAVLEVMRCRDCGHREAVHPRFGQPSDYYENTPQDPRFVESLRVTRQRQARQILARVRSGIGAPAGWFDFGSGRGWFLREARAMGLSPLAGFDTSALATSALRADAFAMAAPSPKDASWPDWASLDSSPRHVSLLDVLEHFSGDHARSALVRLRDELPSLQTLVIKVPVAEGIFFRAARLAKAVAPGAYRQLHQTGTFPPHYHYFCRHSLRALLEQTGFRVVDMWGDRDVDDLFARIPRFAGWRGGTWAATAAGLFPADATIVIALPS